MTAPVAYRFGGRTISESTVFMAALLAAAGGVMITRLWRVGRIAVTAVHEGGHALVALMAGHTVTAVHLRSDSSGTTFHRGRGRWSSQVATAAAGYIAPGLMAVAGAALTGHRDTRAWLAILAGLGALMVIGWVRNLFGIVAIGSLVLAVGFLVARGTIGETVLVGSFAIWYLAMGGFRAAIEQLRAGGRGDAYDLGLLLHLPPVLCRIGFVAAAGGCVVACVALLFGR